MNEEYKNHLGKFYTKLRDYLILKKKLKKDSVLVSLLHMKSNPAYDAFSNSTIPSHRLPKSCYDYLVFKKYIREIDSPGKSVITCQGVWQIESDREVLNIDELTDEIDNKYFNVFKKHKAISEKEKIILLTMVVVRSFSSTAAINLKKSNVILEKLEILINEVFDSLKSYEFIHKLKKGEIFGAKSNEHPVSNLIRHTDGLVKKSKGIYKSLGHQRYYLDLAENSHISIESLTYLFDLIFQNKLTVEFKEHLKTFCIERAYKNSPYIYDVDKAVFINPHFDDLISEALELSYVKSK